MMDDPVESADLEPLQRSLDRFDDHLKAIRTYVGWLLVITLVPALIFSVVFFIDATLGT